MADNNELPGRVTPAVRSLAAVALLVFGASCGSNPVSAETTSIDAAPALTSPTASGPTDGVVTGLTATTPSGVTDDDVAGLLWVREEEQLAHDVYVVLGGLWGLQIFENIAESESSHVGAVLGLLDRYGITDPAAGNDLGTFTDPEIQAMYDELIADGCTSIDAALSVGALIEELDIDDLQARAAATEIPAITRVYANLETGSRNHLRAFVSQLQSRGVTYEPTQLDASTFDAIVSSEVQRGPRR